MTKKIVVLGAGIGGMLAARGIKDKFPDFEVTLIGPEDKNERPGLFYFNQRIPGICEREINVIYEMVGEGSLQDYQVKSRGYSDSNMITSSFKNVGKTVKGYLVNKEISLEGIQRVVGTVTSLNLFGRQVSVANFPSAFTFDYLISTIPLSVLLKVVVNASGSLSGVDLKLFEDEFKFTPVYQKVSGFQKVSDNHIDSIKVFYDLSSSEFYRHSSYYHGDNITRMVSESIKELEDYDSVAYPGKITPSKKLTGIVAYLEDRFSCLKICGRYARWDYHYLVDQTYFDSIKFVESRTKSV